MASAATIFPWALGTFRTLDLSKVFGQALLGFWIYIGSAAFIIAAIGATRRAEPGTAERDVKRTALALVAIYFVVCSTPLVRILYTARHGWLFWDWPFCSPTAGHFSAGALALRKSWAVGTLLVAGLAVLGCNVGAGVIYPKVQAKVETRFLEAQQTSQHSR